MSTLLFFLDIAIADILLEALFGFMYVILDGLFRKSLYFKILVYIEIMQPKFTNKKSTYET